MKSRATPEIVRFPRQHNLGEPLDMDMVPELPRPRRRELIMAGRKSGDPDTATRFLAVAKLGLLLASAAELAEVHHVRQEEAQR